MSKTEKQLDKFLRKKPKLGQGVYLAKTAVVIGDVTLGAHSSVWYFSMALPNTPAAQELSSGGRLV
jgi:carbonic anhydrase/acetyltransferase-like protein (isoleucine patch superfamily)